MRIAVIGAYVSARLSADGHEVVGIGRDIEAARRRFPALDWKRADLARATVEDWIALLAKVEAVVNCADRRLIGVITQTDLIAVLYRAHIVEAVTAG